jgi:hypothetical protein
MSQRTTIFLCPVEGCDTRFKSTHGRTQHIWAKHPNFGINEPESPSRSLDSSPSSHTGQIDQAASDDFLQPPTTYSPQASESSSQPPFDDLSLPISPSQYPAIPSPPHNGSSDADDMQVEQTGHWHSQSTSPSLRLNNLRESSPADTEDESATGGAFTDYHPFLNGKFICSITSALY